jgi:hypothetical protein
MSFQGRVTVPRVVHNLFSKRLLFKDKLWEGCGFAAISNTRAVAGGGVSKSGGLRLYPSLSDHKAAHKATTWISYSSVTEPNLVMIVFIIFVIVEWLLVTLWSKLTNRTIGSFMTVSNQQVSGRYYMYLAECRSWKSGYMYVKEACTTVNFLWHIFGFQRAVGLCIIPVNA